MLAEIPYLPERNPYYVNLPAIAPVVFLQNTETLAFYPIARGGITKAALLKTLADKAELLNAKI